MAITDNLRSAPKLYFVTFAFLCFGGLFVLTATASPNWLVGTVLAVEGTVPYNAGLWVTCVGPICLSIPSIGIYIVIRALCMLALLGSGGSGLAALGFIFLEQRRKQLGYLTSTGCLLSFLSNTITVVVYALSVANSTGLPFDGTVGLGWAFIVSCLGCACLLIASILGFIMSSMIQSNFGQTRFP